MTLASDRSSFAEALATKLQGKNLNELIEVPTRTMSSVGSGEDALGWAFRTQNVANQQMDQMVTAGMPLGFKALSPDSINASSQLTRALLSNKLDKKMLEDLFAQYLDQHPFIKKADGGIIKGYNMGGWVQSMFNKVPKKLRMPAQLAAAGGLWQTMEEVEKLLSLKYGAEEKSSGLEKWGKAFARFGWSALQGGVAGLPLGPGGFAGGSVAGTVEGLIGLIKDGSQFGVKGGSQANTKGFSAKKQLEDMSVLGSLGNIATSAGLSVPFGMAGNKIGKKIKEFANPTINKIKDKLTNRSGSGILNSTDSKFKQMVDSIYKQDEIFDVATATQAPTFQIGKSGERFAFQGYGEDLSGIAKSGVSIVETNPISILQTALRLNPKDKNIQSLLNNFLTHKETGKGIDIPEIEFLDQLKAAVSIDSKGQNAVDTQTDGFAMILASLSGNKNAQNIIKEKTKIYQKMLTPDSVPVGSVLPEDIVDTSQIPVIHSTNREVVRQPDGSIHFYPRGNFHVGDKSMAYPRSTLHTTLGATVESHGAGTWGPDNLRIFSPLDQVLDANGNPRTFNPTDTWFQPAPGKPFIMPNGTIVRPFNDTNRYIDELIKRKLFDGVGDPPLVIRDDKSKEVLQLFKKAYSDSDREEIASMIPHGYLRHSQGIREMTGRSWSKASNPKDLVGIETQVLVDIADGMAKKQIKVDSPASQISGWSLSDPDMENSILKLAEQRGVPFKSNHQSSDEGFMESQLVPEHGGTDGGTWLGSDVLQSQRYAALHGFFKTFFKKFESYDLNKDGYPLDKSGLVVASGGYIKRDINGKFPGIKSVMIDPMSALSNVPKFEKGINMVPANMLAMLHKNEAVVPANMNPFNPNANNATMGGGVYNITNNINGFDGDINALSDMVTRKTVESMKTMSKISVKSMGESRSLGSGLEVRA
jgi:hypothetical protein